MTIRLIVMELGRFMRLVPEICEYSETRSDAPKDTSLKWLFSYEQASSNALTSGTVAPVPLSGPLLHRRVLCRRMRAWNPVWALAAPVPGLNEVRRLVVPRHFLRVETLKGNAATRYLP